MSNNSLLTEQQRIITYLGGFALTPVPSPKGDGCLLAKVYVLWDVLSTGGEELFALLPSVLDSALADQCVEGVKVRERGGVVRADGIRVG